MCVCLSSPFSLSPSLPLPLSLFLSLSLPFPFCRCVCSLFSVLYSLFSILCFLSHTHTHTHTLPLSLSPYPSLSPSLSLSPSPYSLPRSLCRPRCPMPIAHCALSIALADAPSSSCALLESPCPCRPRAFLSFSLRPVSCPLHSSPFSYLSSPARMCVCVSLSPLPPSPHWPPTLTLRPSYPIASRPLSPAPFPRTQACLPTITRQLRPSSRHTGKRAAHSTQPPLLSISQPWRQPLPAAASCCSRSWRSPRRRPSPTFTARSATRRASCSAQRAPSSASSAPCTAARARRCARTPRPLQ